jgi:hypothetical protein
MPKASSGGTNGLSSTNEKEGANGDMNDANFQKV